MDLNTLTAQQAIMSSMAASTGDPVLAVFLARHAKDLAKASGGDLADMFRSAAEEAFPDIADQPQSYQVLVKAMKSMMAEGLSLPLTLATAGEDIKEIGERAGTLVEQYKHALAGVDDESRRDVEDFDQIRSVITVLEEVSLLGETLSEHIQTAIKGSRIIEALKDVSTPKTNS